MGVDSVAVMVEAQEPLLLGDFWASLIERRLTADSPAGCYATDLGGSTVLQFVPALESHRDANQQHIDLASVSLKHQEKLVERALRLGARHVDIGQQDVPWHVMADPEGNEFCILEPRDEYRESGPVAALVTHAKDPLIVGKFWSALIGVQLLNTHPDYTSVRIGSGDPALEFVRHSNPWNGRGRLHLRLVTNPPVDPIGGPDATAPCPVCGPSCAALCDPEQNHLCVAQPRTE